MASAEKVAMVVDHVAGGIQHTDMHEAGVQVDAGIESMLALKPLREREDFKQLLAELERQN